MLVAAMTIGTGFQISMERKNVFHKMSLELLYVRFLPLPFQEFTPRRRSDDNRPRRDVLEEVQSENFNGVHKIYKNSDGTLSCSCPSFMKGNGGSAGALSYACKHVRQVAERDGLPPLNVASPSEWQIAALKKLGIRNPDRLSNCQAYFLINDILAYQGVTYREYEQILREHGKVSVLPILPVGVEFEGYVSLDIGHEGLRERLQTAGLPSVVLLMSLLLSQMLNSLWIPSVSHSLNLLLDILLLRILKKVISVGFSGLVLLVKMVKIQL